MFYTHSKMTEVASNILFIFHYSVKVIDSNVLNILIVCHFVLNSNSITNEYRSDNFKLRTIGFAGL